MSNESNNTSAAATTPPTTAPSSSDPDASEAGLAPEVGDCAGAAVTVAEGSYMGVGGGEVFYYLQNLMKFECAARSTSQSFYKFADISLDLEKMLPYTPSLHARMRGK